MFELEGLNKYKEWESRWINNENSMGVKEYISFNIHPEDFLISSFIFFPEIIEIEGCIILSINYDEFSFEKIRSQNSIQETEKKINSVVVYDLFAHCSECVDDFVFQRVGKLIKNSWLNYFSRNFRDKKIFVEYIDDEKNYGPILKVYQRL